MKSVIAAAALSCSFALAHPPLSFQFYGGVNSSTVAASLLSTGVSNYSLSASNITVDALLASKTGSTTLCGCTTALETTTIYVFASDSSQLDSTPPGPTSASEIISSTSSEPYIFSIVNGTTAWHNDHAPPSDASIFVFTTSTSYVIPLPTDATSTEVTITVTSQRTLTSTIPSESSFRTETIVVIENSLTTIYVSVPPSSSSFETPLTTVDGIVNSPSSPAEAPKPPPYTFSTLITIEEPSSATNPVASYTSSTLITIKEPSSATSPAAVTTASSGIESSSDTLIDGAAGSPLAESEVTVFVTSSRTITLSRSSSAASLVSASDNTLSLETEASIPIGATHALNSTSSAESTLTAEASTTIFPSLSLSGTEGVIFPGSGTGTSAPLTGTAATLSSYSSQSSAASVVSSNSTCIDSAHASGVLTESTENTISPQISSSSPADLQTTASAQTSDFGQPHFTNSTLADPIATQSSFDESLSSTIIAPSFTTTSYTESWTLQTDANTLTNSASLVGTGGTGSSSSLPGTSTLVSLSTSEALSQLSSTEASPVVTSSDGTGSSSMISSTIPSSSVPESTISASPDLATDVVLSPTFSIFSSFSVSTTSTNVGYGNTPPYPISSMASMASVVANGSINCGEVGDFVMNWDDEPLYIQETEADPPYAPVFNPYHHLFFAKGFAYYDPNHSISKPEPYDPVSGPNVAIFHVHGDTPIADRDEKDEFDMLPGTIGAGPRSDNKIYWFNAYSAELGCDNGGTIPCNMTISGYHWNDSTKQEEKAIIQTAYIEPCNLIEDCALQHVDLNSFQGLSSIRFEAVVDGALLKSWVIDNLSMGWFDNSCEAGRKRISAKK